MLSLEFQKKVYRNYTLGRKTHNGRTDYDIAYNPIATVHTWIIRKNHRSKDWEWYMPLSRDAY